MVRIGRILYNMTGVMSNKGLVKNSRKIGDAICDTMKAADGTITPQQIKEIITDTIGKKGASRIKILDSYEDTKKFVLEQGGISLQEFDDFYKEILGCSGPHRYKREAILHLKPKELIPPECPKELLDEATLANVITHETQHAIAATSGKDSFIKKFSKLSFVRKYLDKQINLQEKLGLQGIYTNMQLAAFSETSSVFKKPEELIRSFLKEGDDKNNLFIIKNLIKLYKDEIRSYNVGFKAYGRYKGVTLEGKNFVERVFEKLVEALKQERSVIRKNQLKRFFGLS